jgi:hypothetical protein
MNPKKVFLPSLTNFKLSYILGLCLTIFLTSLVLVSQGQPVVAIGHNFSASTLGVDSTAVPPDADGVVGPLHYVEFINGRFSIFRKSDGVKVQTMTDVSFWAQGGITIPSGWDVTDPRIIFDLISQRWFASQVDFSSNVNINTNHFLLAVSSTADPTGLWKAFSIPSDPGGNNFADFPTLGLDGQGVYLSGDFFDANGNPVGPTLLSIPKAGLLANPPSIAGMTWFGVLDYNVRGNILQPAICLDGSGQGTVLSVGDLGFDNVPSTELVNFQIQNSAGPGKATLTNSKILTVPSYTIPLDPFQPDGSSNLDDGDARISASIREVGSILYVVHNTQLGNVAALRWYRINATNQTVLESGTISDPTNDLFYPSIAANSAGTVVIAYNGSSTNTFVSSFATAGTTVNGVTTFGQPLLLKSGTASYQLPDPNSDPQNRTSRWGDYGSVCVDPIDSSRFWTIQQIPTGRQTWSTQVTELLTGYPTLLFSTSGTNLLLSWSGTLFTLESTPKLNNATWTPVGQNLSTNNGVVTAQIAMTSASEFFRLQAP